MQLISIPANPVPEDATVGTVKTADGALLRFARFGPPAGRKGTLCVFPGRAEFIEKYFEVVRDARARGNRTRRDGRRHRGDGAFRAEPRFAGGCPKWRPQCGGTQ